MRVLVTSQPGLGHWHPLVPLVQALEAAGHEVAFAATPDACATITANGFRCFPVGQDEGDEELGERRARMAGLSAAEQAAFMWVNVFAGTRAERRLPDLLSLARQWQPAVVVSDLTEFAGCIVAESLGLPHAGVQVVAFRPHFHQLIAEPFNRLCAAVGLPPTSPSDMLYRYLLLSPRPPSFQDPTAPLPPTTHAIRYVGFNRSRDEELPAWVEDLADRPTVYATLGTVQNRLTEIFAAMLAGLRDEPINFILTVGRNVDPASFGPQPAHIHIERYIPQSLLLPYCDLVITHGGSGTVMDALSQGLPMVVIPIAADQPANAESCARLGVGRVIAPDQRTPEAIRDATREVLQQPSYRQNAGRVRDEMQALPGLEHAVALLEQLATERVPLSAGA